MSDTRASYAAQRARLEALESKYIPKIRRALLRSIEPTAEMVLAGADAALAAALVSEKEITAVLQKLYAECGTAEAKLQYDALTPTVKSLAPPSTVSRWGERLRQFITGEGAAAVKGITERTRTIVRSVLNEAAALGDGIDVAARKLRQRVAELAPKRARVIARTELVSASNYGSLLGAQGTGVKLEKFWISTKDGRTRPDHANADGQGAPLQDGFFQVGGYPCRYPGDPILPAKERANCRCSVGYRKIV